MAIHSVPLLHPDAMPRFDGADVIFTETHDVFETNARDSTDAVRGLNVLVSVSASEIDRQELWSLRHALAFGRTAHLSGMEWPERLAERVAASAPTFATAVVFVGSSADVAAEMVQTVVDELHRQFASLAAVVVVSEGGTRLAELRGVSGFVRGVNATSGDTAKWVFLALSAFLAPETLDGIDMLDLLPVLGPANAPTVLAEALWIRDGDGRLLCASIADQQVIDIAARIVAIPVVRDWGWSELHRLRYALREATGESTSVVTFANCNAFTSGPLPSGIGWVPILCLQPAPQHTRCNQTK